MSYIDIPSSLDVQNITTSIISNGLEGNLKFENITQFGVPTEKEVTADASVLLAVGSSNAEGRRVLIVRNVGEGTFLLSSSSSGGGRRVTPGQTVEITFQELETTAAVTVTDDDGDGTTTTTTSVTKTYADVSLYARAETRSTTIEIIEA